MVELKLHSFKSNFSSYIVNDATLTPKDEEEEVVLEVSFALFLLFLKLLNHTSIPFLFLSSALSTSSLCFFLLYVLLCEGLACL